MVASVGIAAMLALVGLGFAAMSTNPPFTVPAWLPTLFFALAALVALALLVYLAWGLIARMRLQCPVVLINQQGKTNVIVSKITTVRRPPSRLEHDGVLWEDGGVNSIWGLNVIGPLCPKDYTPLSVKWGDKTEASVSDDTFISASGYHHQLFCLECKTEYTLGTKAKQIKDSRDEVRNRFEGMRRREQTK